MTDDAYNYHVTVTFLAPDGPAQKLYANLKGAQLPELGATAAKPDDSASSDVEVKITWPGRAMNSAAVIKETAAIIERVLRGEGIPPSLTIAAEELGASYPFDYDAMILG